MAGYNLDEKSGLFGGLGTIKSPAKVLQKDDKVEIRHNSILTTVKSVVLDVNDTSVKVRINESIPELMFTPNDVVVVDVKVSDEPYVISGEVASADKKEPFEITIKTSKIEKLKDSIKNQRFFCAFGGSLKVAGIQDNIPAVIKTFSLSAVKVNCKEDILMEDIVEVAAKTDKTNKINFKGRVVRKNKLSDCVEYGIEITELPESSSKVLHQLISKYQFG